MSFGIKNADNALTTLWEKSADKLSPKELEWFAGLSGYSAIEGKNISEVMTTLACIFGDEKSMEEFEDKGEGGMASFLYSLSNQLDTLNGVNMVASSAIHRITNADFYSGIKQGGDA
ncbi:hypothetical protein [Methylobacter sp.]|uniref:hypothetical protein n=1 Tax=Methylobacter sp. TaxID=2051955 RepID=UPI002487D0F2|nr:hypothetical protein [Methylobacter sp.]MDI1277281.1 hypothetical protein [Methylobacter sp.]MDI1357847.1 hypothetical protein [Methylobacter sp.]